ncbi:MAG: PQQ-binding-like beta-propeller repeat protein [Deltaproteobacteria bacterium]|nr:PQQ-binding-like beta-propeller repeat protein [Deltaproteobacteria bacterium]
MCTTRLLATLVVLLFASEARAEDLTLKRLWQTQLPGGGGSSPRVLDLEGDGTPEIAVGGGHMGQGGAAAVVDAKTGKVRWRRRFKDELYATPHLLDVNGDGVQDVLTGGRTLDFYALDGKTGKTLWSLRQKNRNTARLNFNGAVPLPDLDGDGVAELLLSQGGSYDDEHRLVGRSLVVRGASGKLLAKQRSADKKEIYTFPAYEEAGGGPRAILGSGGWTLPGHLFAVSVPSWEEQWRLPSPGRGFVSSPSLFDLRAPGATEPLLDVVAIDFDANLLRVDGRSGEVVWTVKNEGFETTSTPAPGRFGGDATVDVVAAISRGKLPVYEDHAEVIWVDGATGAVLERKTVGVYIQASPVTVDLNGDGLDETLVISNGGPNPLEFGGTLHVFDGGPGKKELLQQKLDRFSACTPWLGDLDGDGKLDLILAHYTHLERWELSGPGAVRWGQFRGPHFTGSDGPPPAGPPPAAPAAPAAPEAAAP